MIYTYNPDTTPWEKLLRNDIVVIITSVKFYFKLLSAKFKFFSELAVTQCSKLSVTQCSELSVTLCSELSVTICSELSVTICSKLSVTICFELSVTLCSP